MKQHLKVYRKRTVYLVLIPAVSAGATKTWPWIPTNGVFRTRAIAVKDAAAFWKAGKWRVVKATYEEPVERSR